MRYSSVLCTRPVPRNPRRRLGFLVCKRCRLPARERRTFPLAVILKRFATDFLVLIPLGRRINVQFYQKSAQYRGWADANQGLIFENWRGEAMRARRYCGQWVSDGGSGVSLF